MAEDLGLLKRAFRVYSHKGPVNRDGAQRSAFWAFQILKCYLTEQEIREAYSALSHAIGPHAEGRGEFDRVMKRIHERLERDGLL